MMDNFIFTFTLLSCGSQGSFVDVKTIKIIASCRGFYYCRVPIIGPFPNGSINLEPGIRLCRD